MANVDLKSLFTSEKQYTVLQLLNVLIDEVGKSMVKTATINQDVDAGTLTITITLSDDSVVTASADLKSLTDTEKSLISTLTTNVNATNEGVTFLKVVGFEGNETHKGNEIHQGYESHLGDESHAGTATYKGVIKTSEIDNTSGNAMLRNKDTEGAIVLGSSTKKAVIMGSGDRPTYSKDGSDFTGSELALKSDIEPIVSLNDKLTELTVTRGTATIVKTVGNVYYSNNYFNIDYTLVVQDVTYGDYNQFQAKFYITLPSKTFINTALGRIVNVTGAMMKNDIGVRRRIGNALVEFTQADSYSPVYMVAEISAATYDINDFQVNFYKDNSLTPSFPSGSPYIGTLHIRIPFAKEE